MSSSYYIVNFVARTNVDWVEPMFLNNGNNVAIPLTSDVGLKMSVINAQGVPVLTLFLGNGMAIIDATAGTFKISVKAARMLNMLPGVYSHDMIMTNSATGETRLIWEGTLTVKGGITGVTDVSV